MNRSSRLLRLARAQASLTAAREARLASVEQALHAAKQVRKELSAALDSGPLLGVLDHSSVLHRICGLEGEIARIEDEAETCRQQLRLSKGRQDTLEKRAATHATAEQRWLQERELQEVTLAMRGKVSGKGAMVK